MTQAVALVVVDLQRTRFGLRSRLRDRLGSRTVLEHALRRVARVRQVQRVILVHPAEQHPLSAIDAEAVGKAVDAFPVQPGMTRDARWVSARKWSLASWRGGLGTACAFDEALPAAPLAAALKASGASAALIVRGDWPLLDPAYAEAQLALHLEHPEAYKLTFTQAPPGLAGVVTGQATLDQLAEHHSCFGQALAYNPRKPQADAIGREVNVPVPASVRDTYLRLACDTPRSAALVQAIADELGDAIDEADALRVTDAARRVEHVLHRFLPQQVTLELTPHRPATGPITPQHHVKLERGELDPAIARRIFEQLGDEALAGDVALRLGGLGDALLHDAWDAIVRDAHEAGVMGICIDTDLHCTRAALDRLLELPIDAVSVRLNADTGQTYRQVMGEDAFMHVTDNLRYLVEQRAARGDDERAALPWIVPRLAKTHQTLDDLEPFFDRWLMIGAQPVIEPAQSGCGLMPEQSPVPMSPPRRVACRQLGTRMTILSDGHVALCDQDWLGRASLGDAAGEELATIWQRVHAHAAAHRAGRYEPAMLCGRCTEWHRP